MASRHDDGSKNRESAEAYARYLAGMDASMRQKVALTAAHLLSEGKVADMGMGSGEGSAALAALYPSLEVVGVDLDAEMVARAEAKHVRANLRFMQGDIAEPHFAPGELDGVFDSSVLHHVTTFAAQPYDHGAAARCLAVQATALRRGGVLVVRDFLLPDHAEKRVLLDLVDTDDGRALGTEADVARKTAHEWRALCAKPGFSMEELAPPRPGWARFALTLRHATEILLRKDYRDDWEAEIKEEYTYFDRARFEEVFASLGLRVLASSPLRNPWIARHRFEGRAALHTAEGEPLDMPATNYVIVGERVEHGASVRFRDAGEVAPVGYLEASSFVHKVSGERRDLVRRPGVVVDVIPFFEHDGRLYVLARTSYPRPILATALLHDEPALDGAGAVPWLAEPLHVQLDGGGRRGGGKPIAQAVEEELAQTAGLGADEILRVLSGTTYYPSPGGLQEEVRSLFVEIAPRFSDVPLEGVSAFSTSGRIRPIEAQQLLRAAQVGGLHDARLELNVRALLTRLGRAHGPWIADRPDMLGLEVEALREDTIGWAQLASRPSRRAYRAACDTEEASFLALHARRFEELDAQGRVLTSAVLELVVPRTRSVTSVATAPLAYVDGVPHLGVDDDDFAAAQCFSGASEMLVAPAWRLPRELVASRAPLRATRAFLRERFAQEHGLHVGEIVELGGRYFPSAGLTPEVVHPWLVIIAGRAEERAQRRLRFVPLHEVLAAADHIVDGHLRVVALRTASMLGALG